MEPLCSYARLLLQAKSDTPAEQSLVAANPATLMAKPEVSGTGSDLSATTNTLQDTMACVRCKSYTCPGTLTAPAAIRTATPPTVSRTTVSPLLGDQSSRLSGHYALCGSNLTQAWEAVRSSTCIREKTRLAERNLSTGQQWQPACKAMSEAWSGIHCHHN